MKSPIPLADLLLRQATVAHQAGRLRDAESLYRKLVTLVPRSDEAHNNLGLVAFNLGKEEEAERALRKAIELSPRNASYYANLAAVQRASKQLEPAITSAKRALSINARLAPAQNTLGLALFELGRDAEAEAAFVAASELDTLYAESRLNMALLRIRQERFSEAEAFAIQTIRLRPNYAKACIALGDAYFGQLRHKGASEAYKRALALQGSSAELRLKLARALRGAGDSESAKENLDIAVREGPRLVATHSALASYFRDRGDLDEAAAEFRVALEIEPDKAVLRKMLSMTVKHRSRDEDILTMEAAYSSAAQESDARMHLAFGLGKALEDIHDYQRAFDLFVEGNALHRKRSPYSEEVEARRLESIRSVFAADYVTGLATKGHPSEAPIFIVGMPRSGTTLTEQIIAGDAHVYGAGELSFLSASVLERYAFSPIDEPSRFVELGSTLDPKAIGETYLGWLPKSAQAKQRFTDKMPHNFRLIGLIRIIFPNAKIVHVSRSPFDTCLSNFKNAFAAEGLNYSYDLRDLGRYYNLYRGYMKHWAAVLPPGGYFTLRYEDLVTTPEPVTRDLFEYLDLEWSPDVLNFHTSKREIHTASFAQVRQPINAASVNLSDRYGSRLDPLREALAEWVEDDSAKPRDG